MSGRTRKQMMQLSDNFSHLFVLPADDLFFFDDGQSRSEGQYRLPFQV